MADRPRYIVSPASGELGRSGFMRLSGYHHLICAAAESDMTSRRMSVSSTIKRGYAWAITSMTVDVFRPVDSCSPLEVSTWISTSRSLLNRRELQFSDSRGECFRSSVFSAPVSMETHRLTRLNEDEYITETGEPLIPDAATRLVIPSDSTEAYRRQVYPSDIDALGHMNNCRYGALAYDALTESERELLSNPFRYTICFRRQLMEGCTVQVNRSSDENGIYISGIQAGSDKPSFIVKLEKLS